MEVVKEVHPATLEAIALPADLLSRAVQPFTSWTGSEPRDAETFYGKDSALPGFSALLRVRKKVGILVF